MLGGSRGAVAAPTAGETITLPGSSIRVFIELLNTAVLLQIALVSRCTKSHVILSDSVSSAPMSVCICRLPTAIDQLHGRDRGGDCDELRLLSDDTTFLNLRAHGGSISMLGTKVRTNKAGSGTHATHV